MPSASATSLLAREKRSPASICWSRERSRACALSNSARAPAKASESPWGAGAPVEVEEERSVWEFGGCGAWEAASAPLRR
eukprot:scaffold251398_cov31-Tisochrysis_lutea.AAC.1